MCVCVLSPENRWNIPGLAIPMCGMEKIFKSFKYKDRVRGRRVEQFCYSIWLGLYLGIKK